MYVQSFDLSHVFGKQQEEDMEGSERRTKFLIRDERPKSSLIDCSSVGEKCMLAKNLYVTQYVGEYV